MKHLIKFSLALLLLFGAATETWSSSNVEPGEGIQQIRAQIIKLLRQPDMEGIDSPEMQSTLHFTVNEKNQLVVLSVETEHMFVDRFLKSRLNYKKVDNTNLRGRYSMKVILKNGSKANTFTQ